METLGSLNVSKGLKSDLNPLDERLTHNVEPQLNLLQAKLVLVVLAAARSDEVEDELPSFETQPILREVEVCDLGADEDGTCECQCHLVSHPVVLQIQALQLHHIS